MSDECQNHHVVVFISENAQQTTEGPCWGFTVLVHELPPETTVEDLVEMGACIGTVLEVRLFIADHKAHIRFAKIDHAIRFMELTNKQPIPYGNGSIKLLMTPSSDYPCLLVRGLPESISKGFLFNAIKRQAPDFELIKVCCIQKNQAVVQFATQRIAANMISYSQRKPLFVGGNELVFGWEGTPAVRVTIPVGFKEKEKLYKAFDVVEGNHLLGVALLKDRAFVYFDYRYNLNKAVEIIGDKVTVTRNDGTSQDLLYFEL